MEYIVKKQKRKTLSIRINKNGQVIVSVPNRTSNQVINDFVNSHISWILKQKDKIVNKYQLLDSYDKRTLKKQSKVLIEKAWYYAEVMNVNPNEVSISYGKNRLGCCYPDNRITLSYYLMAYPEKVQDYVVVHELAHILHKDHSKLFYKEIEKYMPDYKERIKAMKSFF